MWRVHSSSPALTYFCLYLFSLLSFLPLSLSPLSLYPLTANVACIMSSRLTCSLGSDTGLCRGDDVDRLNREIEKAQWCIDCAADLHRQAVRDVVYLLIHVDYFGHIGVGKFSRGDDTILACKPSVYGIGVNVYCGMMRKK